jgi:hypothetical protein
MFPKFHLWFASGKPSLAKLPRIAAYTRTRIRECPLLCGFTATLFGFMPLAYEDSVMVKLV